MIRDMNYSKPGALLRGLQLVLGAYLIRAGLTVITPPWAARDAKWDGVGHSADLAFHEALGEIARASSRGRPRHTPQQ